MNQGRDTNTNPVNAAIREAFGDGKWHAPDATARRVAADQLDVERLLTAATHNRDPAEVDL